MTRVKRVSYFINLIIIIDVYLQGVKYVCKEAALLNSNINPESFLTFYNGQTSNFGTASNASAIGCACGVLGTCITEDYTCNCDARKVMAFDQGFVTDRSALPVTDFTNRYTSPNAQGSLTLTDVRCAPTPIGKEARSLSLFQDVFLSLMLLVLFSRYPDITRILLHEITQIWLLDWISYVSWKHADVHLIWIYYIFSNHADVHQNWISPFVSILFRSLLSILLMRFTYRSIETFIISKAYSVFLSCYIGLLCFRAIFLTIYLPFSKI